MTNPTFSAQEAQLLVNHAQTAPLQNLQHASEVSVVLQKFRAWYEHAVAEIESVESKIEAAVKKAITDYKNRNTPEVGPPSEGSVS